MLNHAPFYQYALTFVEIYGPLVAHHHCHFHWISLLPIHRHIKPLVHGKGLKEQQNSTSCSDAILHFHAHAQLLHSIYVIDFIFHSSPFQIPVQSRIQSTSIPGNSTSCNYMHLSLGLSLLCQHNIENYIIKTHVSELRGQEEAGCTRQTSELFTGSTTVNFVSTLNKPP